ncbi:MAG: type II toxin-antitoxin system HicA family toxin [Capsulimonadaceae bacterium]
MCTGDHHNYKKSGERFIITLPGKPGDEVSPGLLSDIRRKTGLSLR